MAYESGLTMEERMTSLFQPDSLLPDQYFDTFRRKLHLEPEKKLMLAILEDAVACFQKYLLARDNKGKAQFRDNEDWVFRGTDLGIFSFEIVCETLGLEPNYVRRGLAHWKEHRLAQKPHYQVISLRPPRNKPRRASALAGRPRRRLRGAAGR